MRLYVEEVPHHAQRYNTLGDWYTIGDDTLMVRVSKELSEPSRMAVTIHEIVEARLCLAAGITPEQVDEWDMAFTGECEPGDSPNAPYHHQHEQATKIEQEYLAMLGVSWLKHEAECERVEAFFR